MNTKTKEKEAPQQELTEQPKGTGLAVVDFGEDAGAGMENVQAGELKIPFLVILQKNSPQVNPPAQGGVAGAVAGMIFNTATGELHDGEVGLPFVPCYRDHKYLEFTPRNLGGGFVAIYEPNDPKVLDLVAKQGKFGRLWTGTKRNEKGEPLDGTEITETYSLAGIFPAPDGTFRAIASFASTQIKKYQAFMQRQTNMKYANPRSTDAAPLPAVQPPLWAHRWRLRTQFEKNKKGDFFGWTLTLDSKNPDGTEAPYIKSLIRTSDPLYVDAKDFNAVMSGGKAKADYAKAGPAAEAGDDKDPPM